MSDVGNQNSAEVDKIDGDLAASDAQVPDATARPTVAENVASDKGEHDLPPEDTQKRRSAQLPPRTRSRRRRSRTRRRNRKESLTPLRRSASRPRSSSSSQRLEDSAYMYCAARGRLQQEHDQRREVPGPLSLPSPMRPPLLTLTVVPPSTRPPPTPSSPPPHSPSPPSPSSSLRCHRRRHRHLRRRLSHRLRPRHHPRPHL